MTQHHFFRIPLIVMPRDYFYWDLQTQISVGTCYFAFIGKKPPQFKNGKVHDPCKTLEPLGTIYVLKCYSQICSYC